MIVNGDSDYIALAEDDNRGDTVMDALRPVGLEPKRMSSFENTFFPLTRSKGARLSSKDYSNLIKNIQQVSVGVENFFDFLRWCLQRGYDLDVAAPHIMEDRIREQAKTIAEDTRDSDEKAKPKGEDALSMFFNSLSSGSMHVLQPSSRYKGGMDAVFLGAPGSFRPTIDGVKQPTMNMRRSRNEIRSELNVSSIYPTDTEYEKARLSHYETELSQKIVKVGQKAMEILLGGSKGYSVKAAGERIVRQVPTDYAFSEINNLFERETGIKLDVVWVEDLDARTAANFSEYFSLVVVRNPRDRAVQQVVHQEGKEPTTPEGHLSKEGMAVDQCVSFSLAVNIPEDIARFVTQAEGDAKVSTFAMHTWFTIWSSYILRKPGSAVRGIKKGERKMRVRQLPRYIVPASRTEAIVAARKKAGYYLEKGRNNEDNISIGKNGTLVYVPKQEEVSVENAVAYEHDVEQYLEASFSRGAPIGTLGKATTPPLFRSSEAAISDNNAVQELREQLDLHKGNMISCSWDYDHCMVINPGNATRMDSVDLVGSTVPDDLAIADYLGMDFSDTKLGKGKTFAASMSLLLSGDGMKANAPASHRIEEDHFRNQHGLLDTEAMNAVFEFYKYLCVRGRVPTFDRLLEEAKTELEIVGNLDAEGNEYHRDICSQYFSNSFGLTDFLSEARMRRNTSAAVSGCLAKSLTDAVGTRSSNLLKVLYEQNGGNVEQETIESDPHFFSASRSKMSDFGNVYNYLGGRIFLVMLNHLRSMSPAKLFAPDPQDFEMRHMSTEEQGVRPNFREISAQIMPLVTMFSKYVPDAINILEHAAELSEGTKEDTSVRADDIRVPGVVEGPNGPKFFPHQVKTHGSLRRRPRDAILDIAPGGGKTMLGLSDAAACVREMDELGVKIKPLLIAPDNLVGNWCDDMKKLTGNNWNMIPLTGAIWNRWGEDKLTEMMDNLPPNTMVVAGLHFLKSKQQSVVIGTHTAKISNTLEFVRRWGFNYIILDESHRAKSTKSQFHYVVKQLMTSSIVKYVRLATGTLISDRVVDVVGQTALFSAHVFRTEEDFKQDNGMVDENGKVIRGMYSEDAPSVAREKLSHHASVITLKRKEWAFMLPTPVETFVAATLEFSMEEVESGKITQKEYEQAQLHQKLYDTVLEITMENIEELMKQASSSDEDGDGDDNDDNPDRLNFEMDEEQDELAKVNSAMLQTHIARLEQVLTAPHHDPLVAEQPDQFSGFEGFVSAKVRAVVDQIDEHYNIPAWSKGMAIKELDLVSHEGQQYIARKQAKDNPERKSLGTSDVPPSEDREVWKIEPEGKVLIFCRYVPTVDAIYEALPEKYKSVASRYHGRIKDRLANLEALKTDPKMQILCATEMSLNTGHNLQMCSRLIRVESPWAPGDLDQAEARVFRPDPAAAKSLAAGNKPGELYRDIIFLDWVMANGTLDVAKMGRLIAKMVEKNQFDEHNNPRYDALREHHLEPISMGLETIRATPNLDQISDYTDAYQQLNSIQAAEFHEMRANGDSEMRALPTTEMPEGSRRLANVPLLPGQVILDEDNHGLVNGREFFRNSDIVNEDPKNLVGMFALTDSGRGEIVSIRTKRGAILDDGSVDPSFTEEPVGSVTVRLHGIEDDVVLPLNNLYIATNLDDQDRAMYEVQDKYATETARRKAKRATDKATAAKHKRMQAEEKAREQDEVAAVKARAAKRAKEKKVAQRKADADKRADKRKKNEKAGKPINTGLTKEKKGKLDAKTLKGGKPVKLGGADQAIALHPAVLHGFLVLEADMADPDAKLLKKLKFRTAGKFAYVEIKTQRRFYAVLDYIEEKFKLSAATEKSLEAAQEVFLGETTKFQAELAPLSEMSHFFNISHRKVKDAKEIRVWPMVMGDHLRLYVDIETSPAIRRHLGKSIPGASTKWQTGEGMALFFAKTRTDAKRKIAEVGKVLTVENKKEALEEISALRVLRKKR